MAAFNQKYDRKGTDNRRGAAPTRSLGDPGTPEISPICDWRRVDAIQIGGATSQWLITYGDGTAIQIMNGLFSRCFDAV